MKLSELIKDSYVTCFPNGELMIVGFFVRITACVTGFIQREISFGEMLLFGFGKLLFQSLSLRNFKLCRYLNQTRYNDKVCHSIKYTVQYK